MTVTERHDEACVCGHSRRWHSHGGRGDCEHDGSCRCPAFMADPHDDSDFVLRGDDAA